MNDEASCRGHPRLHARPPMLDSSARADVPDVHHCKRGFQAHARGWFWINGSWFAIDRTHDRDRGLSSEARGPRGMLRAAVARSTPPWDAPSRLHTRRPVGPKAGAMLRRCGLSVAPRFLWECLNSHTVSRFQPPPPRTQHADLPHYALLHRSPVGLEILVRRQSEAGRDPGSGRPNAHGSDGQGPSCVPRRRSVACGRPTMRENVPRYSKPGTR